MTNNAMHDVLRGLPQFARLDDDVLDAVAATATVRELAAGDAVFREGQRGEALFAVLAGRVKIFKLRASGRERVVHVVSAGRTFAEAALFFRGNYPASAAALDSPTRLLRLDGPRFLALFDSEPRLGSAMVASLSTWLHTLLEHIDVLSITSAGARLAHRLLRLPASDHDGVLRVTLPLAKKELASELSITPETLSRLLARWTRGGFVRVNGPVIDLLDVPGLETMAESGE